MFLHIGNDIMVSYKEIIAILDYHKLKKSNNSCNFLKTIFIKAEEYQEKSKDKKIKTIVLTKNKIFFSSIASGTIEKRMHSIIY